MTFTPQRIKLVQLPDTSVLEKYVKELAELYKSNAAIKNAEGHIPQQRIDLHTALIREACHIAKATVYPLIFKLADLFGLNQNFGADDLPSVVVVDEQTAINNRNMAEVDGYGEVVAYFPANSFFSAKGQAYFGYPEGPVISLFLPGWDLSALVEESTHFLCYFYWNSALERNIRVPRIRLGRDHDPKNENGKITIHKIPDSELVKATFAQCGAENAFSYSINHEAIAYAVRTLFGLFGIEKENLLSKQEISGIPKERNANDLFKIMTECGRKECYRALFDWNNVKSFKNLFRRYHFHSMLGKFPTDMIHFLGCNLGYALASNMKYSYQIKECGSMIFTSKQSPNKKLDELIDFYNKIRN